MSAPLVPLVPPASTASACDRDEWGTRPHALAVVLSLGPARRIFHWCPPQRDEWGTDFSERHEGNGWVRPKALLPSLRSQARPVVHAARRIFDFSGSATNENLWFPWCPPLRPQARAIECPTRGHQRDEWGTETSYGSSAAPRNLQSKFDVVSGNWECYAFRISGEKTIA